MRTVVGGTRADSASLLFRHRREDRLSTREETAVQNPPGQAAGRTHTDWLLPLVFFSIVIVMYAAIGYGVYQLIESFG